MQHSPQFLALVNEAKNQIKEVNIQEAKKLLQENPKIVIIDVREESEWAQGHLPQAKHLGKGVIERDIEKTIPNKEQTLLLYCGGGFRSALAAVNIQKMGYKNVISMDGGYKGWMDAGLTTEKD